MVKWMELKENWITNLYGIPRLKINLKQKIGANVDIYYHQIILL